MKKKFEKQNKNETKAKKYVELSFDIVQVIIIIITTLIFKKFIYFLSYCFNFVKKNWIRKFLIN